MVEDNSERTYEDEHKMEDIPIEVNAVAATIDPEKVELQEVDKKTKTITIKVDERKMDVARDLRKQLGKEKDEKEKEEKEKKKKKEQQELNDLGNMSI